MPPCQLRRRGQGLRRGRGELPTDEVCVKKRTRTWTGDDCDEVGRTPSGGGQKAPPSIILEVAAEAERIGLDSVWSCERLMRPTVPIALGGAGGPVMDAPEAFGIVYDPIETLACVAAQTSRITLGTSVLDALF